MTEVNLISTDYSRSYIKTLLRAYGQKDRRKFPGVKTIDYEGFLELFVKQEGKCFWTGRQMELPLNDGRRKPSQVSVDRLDNDRPHTLDNCVLVCQSINLMRSNYSMDDWLSFASNLGILSEEARVYFYGA